MSIIRSLCVQCGVGCGIRAVTSDDRHVRIEADRMHPANEGRLCSRGLGLSDATLGARLCHPSIEGRQVGWDRVIAQIARRLSTIIKDHGPGHIALHVGSALLTEDYYVANKLMKGFLGSAHIHAPGRGMASAAQVASLGEDVMPATYEDIERADMILVVGDILSAHPVLLERVLEARAALGTRIILLGDADAALAIMPDLHLPIPPGTADRLLMGLLLHGHDTGTYDRDFLLHNVAVPHGFWDALRPGHDIWSVARACGLPPGDIRAFYEIWTATDRCVTLFGDSDAGTASAVLNLHLAYGRIGKPGAAPFAITASGNGMGARETGCIATHLAAHRDFAPDARASTARFWDARNLAQGPGLEGEALLAAMRDGQIKALWSIGADAGAAPWLAEARALVPLTIRSTDHQDEAADGWNILLPSAAWIEKDGTITGMDRLISRQRRLFLLAREAKPDWWMLTKVAQAMGWGNAFYYECAADIYREHVRLTAYGNAGARLLNLKRHASISNPAYDELTPWRWGEVPFDEGRFPTADGRARLVPIPASAPVQRDEAIA